MDLAVGIALPERTSSSIAASRLAVSDAPTGITGLMSSAVPAKDRLAILISCVRIQLRLPRIVLISPLWASVRNGWASHHCGKVLVE